MEEGTQARIINCGIGLIFTGFLFGLAYNYLSEHQALLNAKDAYAPVFSKIAEGQPEAAWRPDYQRIISLNLRNTRAIDVHAHVINMGLLVVLLGMLYPLAGKDRLKANFVRLGFTNAAWIYPLGLLLQMLGFKSPGEIVAAIGAGLGILAFGVFWLGVLRHVPNRND